MHHRHFHALDGRIHQHVRALYIVPILVFFAGCSSTVEPAPALSPVISSSGTLAEPRQSSNVYQTELLKGPLQLPKLKPGTECPRVSGRQIAPAYGPAIGDGPVYAVGLGTEDILYFNLPAPPGSQFYGSAWSGNKVLWIIAPTYRGPVLIRGGRLDGPEAVRFNGGSNPPSELRIDAAAIGSPTEWRNEVSYTRVEAPGCYAYQVDGQGFREIIVFEARVQN